MLSICLSVSIGIAWSHDLKAASKKQKSGTDLSNVLCEYLPSVDSQIEFFAAAALSGTLSRPQLTTPEKAAEWSLKCALELDKKLKDHLSKSSAENEQRVGMTIC
ncbi:MAG: hypothetical protein BGO31_14325 [Bacteroidetes bacterium 43-16]|nr:MAG: hypothetical protein BGO31_14325 [Bacteroidetes bacterium 43-16]